MSYDFWDDGVDEMLEEQKKESSSNKTYMPITKTWTPGDYVFRIYPENYKGKPRTRRTIWSSVLHNWKRVISTKEDSRIRDLLKSSKDSGYNPQTTELWKHKVNKECIMMVELYSAPENKYITKGTTALILEDDKLKALDAFLDSLEAEGVSASSFLNPNKPSHAFKMSINKVKTEGGKNQTKINVSATMGSNYELNASVDQGLPEGVEFTGLDDVYVKEGTTMSDEEFEDFKEFVQKKHQAIDDYKAQYNEDTSASSSSSGYKPEFDDEDVDHDSEMELLEKSSMGK